MRKSSADGKGRGVVRFEAGAFAESKPKALVKVIEESVRPHILEVTADGAKAANASVNEAALFAIVAEAIEWPRSPEH